MSYKILTIGTKPDAQTASLIDSYQKRMIRKKTVSWHYIPHGNGDIVSSVKQEASGLLSKINTDDYLILLDERGVSLSSEKFSEKLTSIPHKNTVFIIGGAYGVAPIVRERADFIWSLSELVFPHQFVRLLLVEQLYRAQCISAGHPYHHA